MHESLHPVSGLASLPSPLLILLFVSCSLLLSQPPLSPSPSPHSHIQLHESVLSEVLAKFPPSDLESLFDISPSFTLLMLQTAASPFPVSYGDPTLARITFLALRKNAKPSLKATTAYFNIRHHAGFVSDVFDGIIQKGGPDLFPRITSIESADGVYYTKMALFEYILRRLGQTFSKDDSTKYYNAM